MEREARGPRAVAMFTRAPLGAGLYESFFTKASEPAGGRALWIRYTVKKKPRQAPQGSIWLTLFDAGGPLATKETFPASDLSDEPYLRIGDSHFSPERIAGRTTSGVPATWNLAFPPGEEILRHLPERLYRVPFPKTKLESPHPSTELSGTVLLGDRVIDVDAWPAMIGHNWGAEHAERWVWIHAAGFEGHGRGTWIDLALGRVRVGPLTSPWVANGAVSISGIRHRLGGFGRVLQTKVSATTSACEVALPGQGVAVEIRITADPTRSVGWRYADPTGASHDVLNNSVADIALRVSTVVPSSHTELQLRGAATYELGLREADHGVSIQPYWDE